MSWDFAKTLGLRKEDLELDPIQRKVTTAKKGSSLQVLGRPKRRLRLRLGGMATRFADRPIVIKGLSMSFNISGPFLRKHHIDQLHSKQALRVQGKLLQLSHATSQDQVSKLAKVEPVESNVYISQAAEVPAGTIKFLRVRIPDVEAGRTSPDQGIFSATAHFVEHTDLHPALEVLDQPTPAGIATISVMNTTDKTIKVKEGQKYGTYTKQNPDTKPDKVQPGRVARDAAWYTEQFRLKDSPFLQTAQDLRKAVNLLKSYDDLFSHNDDYGHTDLVEHAIYTEDKPPIKCRHRPLNPTIEGKFKEQIDHWLKQDVIEASASPWSFPVIAVPKKNGKIRFVIDYRGLNKITIKDSFPLPNIEDNLSRLAHSRIFSGIDATGAYHVVSVREQDREKTAFSTPWGLYHFKRMPFGLANAPATYCRLVQKVLDGIPMSVAVPYMDDCAIHSRTLDEHLHGLNLVFKAHRKAGLTLQPEKCQLFRDKIEYLGHEISERGISIPRKYIDVVNEWPEPKNVKEVRTFLGKVSYYRRFIPQFSEKAVPLTELTKDPDRDDDFVLGPEARNSFEILKAALSSADLLAYPQFDSDQPFVLDTDWSGDPGAIGGVLSQQQGGEERVIAYGARKLNAAERSYSSHKGELLAAIFFMRHWKYYLQFRPFILRTDHEALKWIRSIEEPKGMIMRWIETLSNFNFKVEFRKGKRHGNADALSRTEHAPLLEETDVLDQHIAALTDIDEDTEQRHKASVNLTMPRRVDGNELLEHQREDEVLQQVKKWIEADAWPGKHERQALSKELKAYASLRGQLEVDPDGLVVRRDPLGLNVNTIRPCIPEKLQTSLLLRCHEEGGHRGGNNTYEQFTRRFYFPGAASEAQMTVKLCYRCQRNKPKPKGQEHTLVSTPVGDAFCKWSIDFVGPFPISRHGNTYILTAKDCFTRWVEAFPTENMTAHTVARTLEKEIFARYGIPEQIHSDQGTQFTSHLIQEVYKELGIEGSTTPTYNPKSNPVERTHRDLGQLLRACVDDHPQDWEDFLPGCLLAMRTAVNRSTGFSPFAMVYGREAALPLDLLYGQPYLKPRSAVPYVNGLRSRLNAIFKSAREHQQMAIQRSRRLYQGKPDGGPLKEGDLVWLYTPRTKHTSRKLALYWTGPWEIIEKLSPVLYRIRSGSWNANQVEIAAGLDRLRRFYGDGAGLDQDSNITAQDVDLSDEFVETNYTQPPSEPIVGDFPDSIIPSFPMAGPSINPSVHQQVTSGTGTNAGLPQAGGTQSAQTIAPFRLNPVPEEQHMQTVEPDEEEVNGAEILDELPSAQLTHSDPPDNESDNQINMTDASDQNSRGLMVIPDPDWLEKIDQESEPSEVSFVKGINAEKRSSPIENPLSSSDLGDEDDQSNMNSEGEDWQPPFWRKKELSQLPKRNIPHRNAKEGKKGGELKATTKNDNETPLSLSDFEEDCEGFDDELRAVTKVKVKTQNDAKVTEQSGQGLTAVDSPLRKLRRKNSVDLKRGIKATIHPRMGILLKRKSGSKQLDPREWLSTSLDGQEPAKASGEEDGLVNRTIPKNMWLQALCLQPSPKAGDGDTTRTGRSSSGTSCPEEADLSQRLGEGLQLEGTGRERALTEKSSASLSTFSTKQRTDEEPDRESVSGVPSRRPISSQGQFKLPFSPNVKGTQIASNSLRKTGRSASSCPGRDGFNNSMAKRSRSMSPMKKPQETTFRGSTLKRPPEQNPDDIRTSQKDSQNTRIPVIRVVKSAMNPKEYQIAPSSTPSPTGTRISASDGSPSQDPSPLSLGARPKVPSVAQNLERRARKDQKSDQRMPQPSQSRSRQELEIDPGMNKGEPSSKSTEEKKRKETSSSTSLMDGKIQDKMWEKVAKLVVKDILKEGRETSSLQPQVRLARLPSRYLEGFKSKRRGSPQSGSCSRKPARSPSRDGTPAKDNNGHGQTPPLSPKSRKRKARKRSQSVNLSGAGLTKSLVPRKKKN